MRAMALTPSTTRRVLVPRARSSAGAPAAPHVRHFRLARMRLSPPLATPSRDPAKPAAP